MISRTSIYNTFLDCLFVCLYPINVNTDETIELNIFEATHMTPGKFYGWLKLNNCPEKICEMRSIKDRNFQSSNIKELSFCHKIKFSYLYIFSTLCCEPLIFQTIKSASKNNLSLKYQRITPSSCRDIGMRKLKFVAKLSFVVYIAV